MDLYNKLNILQENVEDCETIVQHEDVKNYSLPALKKP